MIRIVWLVLAVSLFLCDRAVAQSVYFAGATTAPLAVRQEKAQLLLQLWGFTSQDLMAVFRLNQDSDIDRLQRAYDHLTSKVDSREFMDPDLGAKYFLVNMLVRSRMIDSLDFSDASLMRFFELNQAKYSCEPTAKVSEFMLPNSYVDNLGSTETLSVIGDRLKREDFAQVSYDVTGRFGKPYTGLLGDLTRGEVGEPRFSLYRQAFQSNGIGGPFRVSEGFLFVKVYSLNEGNGNCFAGLKEEVARDYGREWLKKIRSDTLTTLSQEMGPQVTQITTVPLTTETAYTVNGRKTTFGEARAVMSHLFGDENSVAFWKSIQRQALESELFYRSRAGQETLRSTEYREMTGVLNLIRAAKDAIESRLRNPPEDQILEAWYDRHKLSFVEIGKLSYDLYRCDESIDSISCGALLDKLTQDGQSSNSASTVALRREAGVDWNSQTREIQVACQNLNSDEWSTVFSLEDKPARLFLTNINRHTPTLRERYNEVLGAWKTSEMMAFWQNFAGVEDTVAN